MAVIFRRARLPLRQASTSPQLYLKLAVYTGPSPLRSVAAGKLDT